MMSVSSLRCSMGSYPTSDCAGWTRSSTLTSYPLLLSRGPYWSSRRRLVSSTTMLWWYAWSRLASTTLLVLPPPVPAMTSTLLLTWETWGSMLYVPFGPSPRIRESYSFSHAGSFFTLEEPSSINRVLCSSNKLTSPAILFLSELLRLPFDISASLLYQSVERNDFRCALPGAC